MPFPPFRVVLLLLIRLGWHDWATAQASGFRSSGQRAARQLCGIFAPCLQYWTVRFSYVYAGFRRLVISPCQCEIKNTSSRSSPLWTFAYFRGGERQGKLVHCFSRLSRHRVMFLKSGGMRVRPLVCVENTLILSIEGLDGILLGTSHVSHAVSKLP